MAKEEVLDIDFGELFSENEEVVETPDEDVDEVDQDLLFDSDDVDEDVDEEPEKKEKAPSDESNNSSSSSNYHVFAKALYDEGVLSSFTEDKEIKSAEELIDSIRGEINGQVSVYKESLPELVKDMIDRYEDGMDLNEFIQIKKESFDFGSISEDKLVDNEDTAKKVLKRDFLDMGYTEDEADEEIASIYELGREEQRSKTALKRIKNRLKEKETTAAEEAKRQSDERRKAYDSQLKAINKSLEDTKEIAGIEITGKMKKDAFKAMTEIVGESNGSPINAISKSRLENPIEFDKNMGLLWVATNGFKDWSKLNKGSKNKAIEELEKALDKPAKQPSKSSKSNPFGGFYPDETIFTSLKL
jgi:hypothetical protein